MKIFSLCLLMIVSCGALAEPITHTVRKGDTLYGIADQYNTSVQTLIRTNHLNTSKIKPGQNLVVANKPVDIISPHIHTVRRGDSLFTIARLYRTSIDALRSINRLSSNTLMPGQRLKIPGASYIDTSSGLAAVSTPPESNVHVVRKGESLWKIASRHNISLRALRSQNQLTSRSLIKPGQRLVIPSGTVFRGDSRSNDVIASAGKPVYLKSHSAIIVDAQTGATLYSKNANQLKPIASITKLMTAMVTLDANLPMDETLTIERADIDWLKRTSSRLPMGTKLTRLQMLHLALMSSENRAASALSRHYPGGKPAFIAAMNAKARALGMERTHFSDATGLTPENVSTAEELVKMVQAASSYDLIHQFTTTAQSEVAVRPRNPPLQYRNSNVLVQKGAWNIDVSKTGYINEAGRCLVMKAEIGHRPAVMVFLQSNGKYTPVGDANRVKKWIESGASGITMASL